MKGILNLNTKFGHLLNQIGQLIILSFYWLVFSLPIFTWGPASCALYTCCRKMLQENEGKLSQCFWQAFKQNFKQGCIVGIAITVFLLTVLYCAMLMVALSLLKGTLGILVGIIYLVIVGAILVYSHYVLAYIARFEDPLKTVLRNCVYLFIVHFDKTLRLAIQFAGVCAAVYFLELIPYLPLVMALLPGAYTMMQVDPLEKVFKMYLPKEETEWNEAD